MFFFELIGWIACVFSLICCFAGKMVWLFLLISVVLGIASFSIHLQRKDKVKSQAKVIQKENESQCPRDTVIVDESTKNYELFDEIMDNSVLCYEYENDLCLIDTEVINHITGNGGESIDFVREQDNGHDPNAIAIYLTGEKIGYVYKGTIQDMINDWICRNGVLTGYINKIFLNENRVTYKIGFYKPLDSFYSKVFSLVKTKKRIDEDTKREDNLYCVDEGDEVTIEYDDFCDNYVVFNKYYEEIGEVNESGRRFIEDADCKKVIGIVKDFSYTDNDSAKLKISIYLIK